MDKTRKSEADIPEDRLIYAEVMYEDFSLNKKKCTQAANDQAESILINEVPSPRKRTQDSCPYYTDELWAKIARAAIDNRIRRTARKYTFHLGHSVHESTVRGMKAKYLCLQNLTGIQPTTNRTKRRGKPLILGSLIDSQIQNWTRGVINAQIVMTLNKKLLLQYGRSVDINIGYAQSLLRHMNFVKRKGTKGTKKVLSR